MKKELKKQIKNLNSLYVVVDHFEEYSTSEPKTIEAQDIRKKLDEINVFLNSLKQKKVTEDLINDVIATITNDIRSEELEALEELLYFMTYDNLVAYLPEEDQEKYLKKKR